MEFNGTENIESRHTLIADRSCEFKTLLSYFENMSDSFKTSTPSILIKEKPTIIEQKLVTTKKQKRVTFDLSKNAIFICESEDSIQRRLESVKTQKENITIQTASIKKPTIIEQKPVVKKKQKRVTFDLSKNTTFVYESEDSIQRRLKIGKTQKENITIQAESIIMPMQFEIYQEPEGRMFDYKEIRHFWDNRCK